MKMNGAKAISVAVVEDDPGVRRTLVQLISKTEGFESLGVYPDAELALKEIPSNVPDVVLLDIHLEGMNGVECVRQLKGLVPGMQVVMLTAYENTDYIFQALASGATGYLLKQTSPEELLAGIRAVHQGGSPMSSHIARKVVQSFQKREHPEWETALSPREREVLECLSRGFLYKEIAEQLSISFGTVHTHIRRIYEKLHVSSRTEAVAKYLRR